MRLRGIIVGLAAGLVLGLAAPVPADAQNKPKKQTSQGKQRRAADADSGYQGGVLKKLRHGRDDLGTDPDPHIRSQLIRDLGTRYGND
jgi:hypothetical protein